jgi:predicted ABC-type ATPase
MGKPVFYLLAGPNGAGKSTLYRALVLAGTMYPPERILARYPRTLAHLTQAVRLADAAILYDSACVSPGTHIAVATCQGNGTQELMQPMPEWARRVLWD